MDGRTDAALTAFAPAAWIDRHATAENALVATGLVIAVTIAFAAANQLLHLDAAHAVEVIGVRSPGRIAAAADALNGRERAWRTVLAAGVHLHRRGGDRQRVAGRAQAHRPRLRPRSL